MDAGDVVMPVDEAVTDPPSLAETAGSPRARATALIASLPDDLVALLLPVLEDLHRVAERRERVAARLAEGEDAGG